MSKTQVLVVVSKCTGEMTLRDLDEAMRVWMCHSFMLTQS